MTLSDVQAKAIITNNPNRAMIAAKRSRFEIMKAHVTGVGDDKLMQLIDNFERKTYLETRKKIKMGNKDVIARTMQPRDKIFSAKGGVMSFNFNNMDLVEGFRDYLHTIRGTQSLKKYVQQVITPRFDYDPEGLIWLDLNNDLLPEPCFKSIMVIYDYELNGRKPEYVALELSNSDLKKLDLRLAEHPEIEQTLKLIPQPEHVKLKPIFGAGGMFSRVSNYSGRSKFFRVVCDSWDRIIYSENTANPIIISQIPNPFIEIGVPGLILSDIPGTEMPNDDYVYESCIEKGLDILTQLMTGRSLSAISTVRVGYPKEWMQLLPCPTCNGQQVVGVEKCPECSGTGQLPRIKHSDVFLVDYANEANAKIPNPPLGTVAVDVAGLEYMDNKNYDWEALFGSTIWGNTYSGINNAMSKKGSAGGDIEKTAYETGINEQPKHDKQNYFSQWAGEVIKFYVDGIGRYLYPESYINSGIMLGKRFMVESADATFDRLCKARQGGATKSELTSLTMEYLENKYCDDPIGYKRGYCLMIAEPFLHDNIATVLTWEQIQPINKLEKIYFDDWSDTLTDLYFVSLPDIDTPELEIQLKKDLREYTIQRMKDDMDANKKIESFIPQPQIEENGEKTTTTK